MNIFIFILGERCYSPIKFRIDRFQSYPYLMRLQSVGRDLVQACLDVMMRFILVGRYWVGYCYVSPLISNQEINCCYCSVN